MGRWRGGASVEGDGLLDSGAGRESIGANFDGFLILRGRVGRLLALLKRLLEAAGRVRGGGGPATMERAGRGAGAGGEG